MSMQELQVYSPDERNSGRALSDQHNLFLEAEKREPGRFEVAFEELRHRCIVETLRLTGVLVRNEEVTHALRDQQRPPRANDELIVGQREALTAIEKAATNRLPLDGSLLSVVHRLSSPPHGGGFRSGPAQPQFENAEPSRSRDISDKVGNLADWLETEGMRCLQAPEKAALTFVRLLEIAPFASGNFRSSHLILNYFAYGGGYPPFFIRSEDADEVRKDIERALRFETKGLVERLTTAQMASLRYCLQSVT